MFLSFGGDERPKLAGECRGLANQKMLADPVLTRLRLHGIVPNAGRSGQVVSEWFADPVPRDFRNAVTCQRWRSKPARWKSPSTPQARAGRRPCHSSQHSGTLSCIIRTGPRLVRSCQQEETCHGPWIERTERRRLRLEPGPRPGLRPGARARRMHGRGQRPPCGNAGTYRGNPPGVRRHGHRGRGRCRDARGAGGASGRGSNRRYSGQQQRRAAAPRLPRSTGRRCSPVWSATWRHRSNWSGR